MSSFGFLPVPATLAGASLSFSYSFFTISKNIIDDNSFDIFIKLICVISTPSEKIEIKISDLEADFLQPHLNKLNQILEILVSKQQKLIELKEYLNNDDAEQLEEKLNKLELNFIHNIHDEIFYINDFINKFRKNCINKYKDYYEDEETDSDEIPHYKNPLIMDLNLKTDTKNFIKYILFSGSVVHTSLIKILELEPLFIDDEDTEDIKNLFIPTKSGKITAEVDTDSESDTESTDSDESDGDTNGQLLKEYKEEKEKLEEQLKQYKKELKDNTLFYSQYMNVQHLADYTYERIKELNNKIDSIEDNKYIEEDIQTKKFNEAYKFYSQQQKDLIDDNKFIEHFYLTPRHNDLTETEKEFLFKVKDYLDNDSIFYNDFTKNLIKYYNDKLKKNKFDLSKAPKCFENALRVHKKRLFKELGGMPYYSNKYPNFFINNRLFLKKKYIERLADILTADALEDVKQKLLNV